MLNRLKPAVDGVGLALRGSTYLGMDEKHDDRSGLVQRLFQQNNRELIGFLVARLGSEADAQEVAQEAYVHVLELDRPDTISFLRAYLFRTAANIATDRLRHRAVGTRCALDQAVLFEQLLTRPSPERTVLGEQQLECVKKTLLQLPRKCREACALHFFADYSVGEIATKLRLSERMVRYHIARGLAQCINNLGSLPDTTGFQNGADGAP